MNVGGLKNNPSDALRRARKGVVVVMNRGTPDALIVGIEAADVLDFAGVRPALAFRICTRRLPSRFAIS